MNVTTPFGSGYKGAVRASRIAKVRERMTMIGAGLDSAKHAALDAKEQRFIQRKRESARPPGFYAVHCAHDKPLWQPCFASTCRRDKREAASNWDKLVRGELK